ncbi:MAG: archease [Phycisphaerales bacterium]|nr:archease [Phycisphaerales bacterium]
MADGFELFDHTADLGVRVWAATPAGLLRPALAGLYAALGEVVPGEQGPRVELSYGGGEAALLLRDFLADALLRLETEACVLTDVEVVQFDGADLRVSVVQRPLDRELSVLLREVKAVTYHELELWIAPAQCEFRYIVDI